MLLHATSIQVERKVASDIEWQTLDAVAGYPSLPARVSALPSAQTWNLSGTEPLAVPRRPLPAVAPRRVMNRTAQARSAILPPSAPAAAAATATANATVIPLTDLGNDGRQDNNPAANAAATHLMEASPIGICSICLDPVPLVANTSVVTLCNHTFCRDCLLKWIITNLQQAPANALAAMRVACPVMECQRVIASDIIQTLFRTRLAALQQREARMSSPLLGPRWHEPPAATFTRLSVDVTDDYGALNAAFGQYLEALNRETITNMKDYYRCPVSQCSGAGFCDIKTSGYSPTTIDTVFRGNMQSQLPLARCIQCDSFMLLQPQTHNAVAITIDPATFGAPPSCAAGVISHPMTQRMASIFWRWFTYVQWLLCAVVLHLKAVGCISFNEPAWMRRMMSEHSETQSGVWKRYNTRDCPTCKIPIQKTEGCDHMRCTFCGSHFCYKCESLRAPFGSCPSCARRDRPTVALQERFVQRWQAWFDTGPYLRRLLIVVGLLLFVYVLYYSTMLRRVVTNRFIPLIAVGSILELIRYGPARYCDVSRALRSLWY